MSYRIKRLLIISVAIIILAVAASEGTKYSPPENKTETRISYPNIPDDINPSIIDESIGIKTTVSSKSSAPAASLVSAEAYLVKNLDTGKIYSERNTRSVFPIASITKLITALVALENIGPDKKITITQEMLDGGYGDAGHLVVGESLTVSELTYPLLMESSNDVAEALAQSYGYGAFLGKMNEFVSSLGMSATSFRDASGMSSGNVSSANDLYILAKYLYTKKKPILDLSRTKVMALASTTEHGEHTFKTINPFSFDPNFVGGKTGRTNEAKESMISLFRYEQNGISYPVAIIVLRSDFVREIDSSTLFGQFLQKIKAY
ncbi:MAG: serine hydrolase [bacterium]|nr:serine hydrolase [bacterium]